MVPKYQEKTTSQVTGSLLGWTGDPVLVYDRVFLLPVPDHCSCLRLSAVNNLSIYLYLFSVRAIIDSGVSYTPQSDASDI